MIYLKTDPYSKIKKQDTDRLSNTRIYSNILIRCDKLLFIHEFIKRFLEIVFISFSKLYLNILSPLLLNLHSYKEKKKTTHISNKNLHIYFV